jgi:nucleoside-diphosphate-sugar epimerase
MPEQGSVVCVTGASGFVGRHLVRALQGSAAELAGGLAGCSLRLLRHRAPVSGGDGDYPGDLARPDSLAPFLRGARLLINLASPAHPAEAMRSLAAAARAAGVRRVLHVSTATVVGRSDARVITEATPCAPRSAYERGRLEAEQALRAGLGPDVDLGILRPTAIIGAGAANLRTLAATILHGPSWRRSALRFLHGGRQMHLVPVGRVVAALLFLAGDPRPLAGEAFIVTTEHDPLNRYQALDAHLGALLGRPLLPDSGPQAPRALLRVGLRLRGRSQHDPDQRFAEAGLARRGFADGHSLGAALAAFAAPFVTHSGPPG